MNFIDDMKGTTAAPSINNLNITIIIQHLFPQIHHLTEYRLRLTLTGNYIQKYNKSI